ncbi:hypothetical protein F2Q69_00059920 [Brassica cretica]|uniref:Zinc finger GRF-type domain-containing protein n=1 Tax=Brassica cretica TaxID=69181 RepID=A0A8S9RH76_BRACR|nr:hypothetical protein F2Q69_00059920 [Brassica cretica]
MRREGIKATKASRNGSKGKAIEDYKSILELKMEDLARKEKLSKLAILNTLLAKKDPLCESEETVKNKLSGISFCLVFYVMGLDYSYTQPSDLEDYGLWNSADSGNNSTEMNILISYIRTDPGRRFYTCKNIDDGDCHVHKWWDVAATEEIKAIGTQYALLSDKVDYLASVSDYESELNQVKDLHYESELKLAVLEKTVSELSKKKSLFRNGFELVLGGLVLLVMVISMFVMLK